MKDDRGRIAASRFAHEQDETTFVMTDEHIPCAQEHHSWPNAEYDMEVNRSMLEELCMFEREVDLRDVEARRLVEVGSDDGRAAGAMAPCNIKEKSILSGLSVHSSPPRLLTEFDFMSTDNLKWPASAESTDSGSHRKE